MKEAILKAIKKIKDSEKFSDEKIEKLEIENNQESSCDCDSCGTLKR